MPITLVESCRCLSMQAFIRNIIGVFLVVSLSLAMGCTAGQSAGKTATPGLFSWMQPREPERPQSVSEFIAQPRVLNPASRL